MCLKISGSRSKIWDVTAKRKSKLEKLIDPVTAATKEQLMKDPRKLVQRNKETIWKFRLNLNSKFKFKFGNSRLKKGRNRTSREKKVQGLFPKSLKWKKP